MFTMKQASQKETMVSTLCSGDVSIPIAGIILDDGHATAYTPSVFLSVVKRPADDYQYLDFLALWRYG